MVLEDRVITMLYSRDMSGSERNWVSKKSLHVSPNNVIGRLECICFYVFASILGTIIHEIGGMRLDKKVHSGFLVKM